MVMEIECADAPTAAPLQQWRRQGTPLAVELAFSIPLSCSRRRALSVCSETQIFYAIDQW